MPYLDNEDYLLKLLSGRKLISSEQRKLISLRKDQQRYKLLQDRQGRRPTGIERQFPGNPDLVDIIVSLNFEVPGNAEQMLTEDMIIQAVAEDLGIPFKKLDPLELDLEIVTRTIPKTFALKHLLLPISIRNGVLDVVLYEPDSRIQLRDIERANRVKTRAFLSTKSDIQRMLAEFFGFQRSISAAEDRLGGPSVDLGNLEQYVRVAGPSEISSSDQHITAAVDHMFNYAFDERASDIHIEPKRTCSLVRLRIDGVLHTIYKLPKAVHAAIISRVKTLSRLDIAEKRRPQDGRIKVDRQDKEAEIRVSTIPVAFGEKAVLRILDPDIMFQSLSSIGFSERDYAVYTGFMEAPHGIFLVTGPTGSGKSTTLYSTLKSIATPEINVVTVEDPVEMVHEEFNQISVQPQVDVTFSTILRNILRQDPDIIMIGEIRDLDTAVNAIQAALTGHLVFSTLHTNDAVSSISRLLDLGAQPFLLGSTLLGAMAQRLVRTICPHCAEVERVSAEVIRGYGFPAEGDGEIELQKGKGCLQCRGTGYLGRCGIFELFPVSEKISRMISRLEPESEIRKVAIQEGMTTLRDDAWQKVKNGITTCEEAIRAVGAS